MAIPSVRRTAPLVAAGLALTLSGCQPMASTSPMPPSAPSAAAEVALQGTAASVPSPNGASLPVSPAANRLVPIVLAAYPHDPAAFTQGLLLDGGALYESTGLEGQSTLRLVDVESGRVVRRHDVPADVFAEGLALVEGTLVQLSWQEGRAFEYDRGTFAPKGEFRYDGEGWGLCFDGRRLVMSDGSDRLTFRDPTSFVPTGGVTVTLDGVPLTMLNELECVGDRVYANVWQTNVIVAIDPSNGRVVDTIDASALLLLLTDDVAAGTPSGTPPPPIDVLNGIAYDPADETFLVTGKLWPKLFRVQFKPAGAPTLPTPGAPAP